MEINPSYFYLLLFLFFVFLNILEIINKINTQAFINLFRELSPLINQGYDRILNLLLNPKKE